MESHISIREDLIPNIKKAHQIRKELDDPH
jgi:hypothetical protein